jgi:hypothetical protein
MKNSSRQITLEIESLNAVLVVVVVAAAVTLIERLCVVITDKTQGKIDSFNF